MISLSAGNMLCKIVDVRNLGVDTGATKRIGRTVVFARALCQKGYRALLLYVDSSKMSLNGNVLNLSGVDNIENVGEDTIIITTQHTVYTLEILVKAEG